MEAWRQAMLRGRGNLTDLLIPLMAVGAALVIGLALILLIGKSPVEAAGALLLSAFGSVDSIAETLVNTIPLILTGLSVALAFRCGLFNIGGEGQYIAAQVVTAYLAYAISLPGWLHPTVALLGGALAGGLWGALPGALKAYRGVHEVVNTIMLNYVALFGSQYLLTHYMKKPGQLPVSHDALPSALLAPLIPGTRLTTGLLWALLAAALVYVLLWRTVLGYEIRAVGLSPQAAEYGGVPVARRMVSAMLLAGALSGLAGSVQILGLQGRFYEPFGFSGYGFDGIAVALVGRNHPVGVVLAAILFGILERGGPAMQAVAGVPKAVTWIIQATVIFLIATDGVIRAVLARRARAAATGGRREVVG